MNWCLFILFLDLSKAFDKAVREIVLGMPPSGAGDVKQYLVSIGMPPIAAGWIADYLKKNGCLLKQWGVHPHVIRLIAGLHDGCWFRYGSPDTIILAQRGGRQGCQSGPTVFNAQYSLGLGIVQQALAEQRISLRLKVPSQPFWIGATPEDNDVDVVDATYVDDECFVFVAYSCCSP